MDTLAQSNKRKPTRTRVAIVGAAGSIGEALCRELSQTYDIVAVTGVEARASAGEREPHVAWRHCDLFSLKEMTRVLAGARFGIFLAHSGLPNSRFHQANCGDMDLLMTENFARAAEVNGTEHIFCLRSLLPTESVRFEAQKQHHQIGEALASYSTPTTVLCSGLVMEPGSAVVRLIRNLVSRSRFIPVPDWSLHSMQPIATQDLVGALLHCLHQPSRFTCEFAIGGPEIINWQQFLEKTAELLGCRPRIFRTGHISPSQYAWWLRRVRPGVHPEALQLYVENLQCDTIAGDNPLQRELQPTLKPALDALRQAGKNEDVRQAVRFRRRLIHRHDEQLRAANTVRSIQRVKLPIGRDAAWLSQRYFNWLAAYLRPLVQCGPQPDSPDVIRITGLGICLLRLELIPERSSSGRRIYYIKDGLLASRTSNRRGRMEFRVVLGGRYAMVAIHDFAPALPWHFYLATQAAMHRFVMGVFQRYIESRAA